MKHHAEMPIEMPDERNERVREASEQDLDELVELLSVDEAIEELLAKGVYTLDIDEKDHAIIIRDGNGRAVKYDRLEGMKASEAKRIEELANRIKLGQRSFDRSGGEQQFS